MTAKFRLVIDCADPEPLARFWVAASLTTKLSTAALISHSACATGTRYPLPS